MLQSLPQQHCPPEGPSPAAACRRAVHKQQRGKATAATAALLLLGLPLLLLLAAAPGATAFQPRIGAARRAGRTPQPSSISPLAAPRPLLPAVAFPSSSLTPTTTTRRHSSPSEPEPAAPPALQDAGDEEEEEYGVIARLREEAESPFRPLRFFVYGSMAASGAIGALITFTGALAAASGVRGATPLSESGQNLAIDVGAVVFAAVLWKLDQKAKGNRLNRLTLGAKIAQLKVQLQAGENGERPVRALADFRRGRGDAKRVVVVAGSQEVVQAALDAARPLRDRLVNSAFLLVPVVLSPPGQGEVLGLAQERLTGALGEPYVGWPLLLAEWQEYLATEAATARKQGVDPEKQGFSIVLKLNGRVGQRAIGTPNWDRLAGDVERRKSRGLDVTNI